MNYRLITNKYKLTGLNIEITNMDISAQCNLKPFVHFESALDLALNALLNDNAHDESPIWLLKNLPTEYGLPENPSDSMVQNRIIELINQQGATLRIKKDLESESCQWSGKIIYHPTGEQFSTTSYWIFELIDGPFIDINYLVIDKHGNRAAMCWGVN